jgi:outer membrane protein assembly factor BamE (lipoprotein component of BamABCDE complex)
MLCQAKDLWKSQKAWLQLNKKMTTLQVTGLLGEPLDKELIEPFEVWYYHESPQRTDGRITWRPKNGFVRFKNVPIDGQEAFLLLDWKQPLWRDVPRSVPEINEPAIPIQTIAPVEPVKEEPVKTEVNLPPPPPQEPAPAPKPQPKPETTWQDLPATAIKWFKSIPLIWRCIGIGVIAFLIYAILKPDPAYRTPKRKDNSK